MSGRVEIYYLEPQPWWMNQELIANTVIFLISCAILAVILHNPDTHS